MEKMAERYVGTPMQKGWTSMINMERATRIATRKRHQAATASPALSAMTEHSPRENAGKQAPAISVSESDASFTIHADFSMIDGTDAVTVEFAQQGVVIHGGGVQRYIPIPTDGDVERATVRIADRIARIVVPTAGLGHRWRAIVLW